MMTSFPTLAVQFHQQRGVCILDPTLALSRYGISLIKQLPAVMELWLVREFWHILDNTQFYLQHPELLLLNRVTPSITLDRQRSIQQEIIRSLQEWEQIRQQTDLANLKLFWVGDRIGESLLPSRIKSDIIWRYESFARSLENQVEQYFDASETLTSAFRDTAALAATLNCSFILTHQLSADVSENHPPGICMALQHWGIPCQSVTLHNEIAILERNYWRQLFVQAGLSKFLWADLHLTGLHLLVPATTHCGTPLRRTEDDRFSDTTILAKCQSSETNLWEGAQGFWYPL